MARAPEPVSYVSELRDGLGLDGDRFDLDQQPGEGERLHHHCGARRRITAKDFGTRAEHIHELGGVRDVSINLDDVLQTGIGCSEDALDITEYLARLRLHVAFTHQLPARIVGDLT